MWIKSWNEFFEAAEKLYLQHPATTRYSIKYRHCDGKLELKVTNDIVCLKFKSDQAQDLKNVEKLNQLFLRHMTSKKDAPDEKSSASPAPAPAKPAPAPASPSVGKK